MKQTRLKGYVYDFLVGFGSTDVDDVLDYDKYLFLRNTIKSCLKNKKMFIELLTDTVNAFNNTKYIYLKINNE